MNMHILTKTMNLQNKMRGVIGIPTSAIEKITVINGTINFNTSTTKYKPK